ncbi:FABP family protein [Blastococcus sp. SYSU D00820]
MSDRTELPFEDTVDVRTGPEVGHELLGLLPLLGEWHGEGVLAAGVDGRDRDRRFGQWARFAHDGRGFLAYESRTWLLSDDGRVEEPGVRESGFWRARGEDDVELLVVDPAGLVQIAVGRARTSTSWELISDVLARTPDAADVTREVRLYGIVDGALAYAIDRATGEQPARPVMSARLERIR